MTKTLDGETTEDSERRRRLGRRLAETCPVSLAQEIAITGSAARGRADGHSDLELNLWVEAEPDPERWQSWLVQTGATDVTAYEREADSGHFHWCVCRMADVWVEVGWALVEEFDAFVRELAEGVYIGHERLQSGWMVAQAIQLRTNGQLAQWKRALATYPLGLAKRVIYDQTSVWSDPHVAGVRWGLAARDERMGLALRFVWDMQNLLRVLFAMNGVWDRDFKWTDERSLDLPVRPESLSDRINAIFASVDLYQAVETNQRLIVETLELASEHGFDVSAALTSMKNGLRDGLRQNLLT